MSLAEIEALDTTRLDATLAEIALQIDRLRTTAGLPSAESSFSGEAAAGPNPQRTASNALCFGDSALGLDTPEALDLYLTDLEGLAERVDTTMEAFDSLKAINPRGSCPTFMTDIIVTVERSLDTFSRRDISDVVFHLETCWLDEAFRRQAVGTPDMDAQYRRARAGLVEYGSRQRSFREASAWCE